MGKSKPFVLFIEFNGNKSEVIFKTMKNHWISDRWITLDLIIDKIRETVDPEISFETHLFEVFDDVFRFYIKCQFRDCLVQNRSVLRVRDRDLNVMVTKLSETDVNCVHKSNGNSVSAQNQCSIDLKSSSVKTVLTKEEEEVEWCLASAVEWVYVSGSRFLSQPRGQSVFWQRVSNQMKTNYNYIEFDSNECQIRYEELIYRVLNALKSGESLEAIQKCFQCFQFLITIDLKLFLAQNVCQTCEPFVRKYREMFESIKGQQNCPTIEESVVSEDSVSKVNEEIDSNDKQVVPIVQLSYNRKGKVVKPRLLENEKLNFDIKLVQIVMKGKPNIDWISVSNSLKMCGFEVSNPRMCKTRFGNCINKLRCDLNRRLMGLEPKECPLLRILYDIDIRPFVQKSTYYTINELKTRLDFMKSKPNDLCLSSNTVQTFASEKKYNIPDIIFCQLVIDGIASNSGDYEINSMMFWMSVTQDITNRLNVPYLPPIDYKTRFYQLIDKFMIALISTQTFSCFDYLFKTDLKPFLDQKRYQSVIELKNQFWIKDINKRLFEPKK